MNNHVKTLDKKFYSANEISSLLSVSLSSSYKIIRELNKELNKEGKITIRGKVSKRYFNEKVYL